MLGASAGPPTDVLERATPDAHPHRHHLGEDAPELPGEIGVEGAPAVAVEPCLFEDGDGASREDGVVVLTVGGDHTGEGDRA